MSRLAEITQAVSVGFGFASGLSEFLLDATTVELTVQYPLAFKGQS